MIIHEVIVFTLNETPSVFSLNFVFVQIMLNYTIDFPGQMFSINLIGDDLKKKQKKTNVSSKRNNANQLIVIKIFIAS